MCATRHVGLCKVPTTLHSVTFHRCLLWWQSFQGNGVLCVEAGRLDMLKCC